MWGAIATVLLYAGVNALSMTLMSMAPVDEAGNPAYVSSTVVLVAEFMKLVGTLASATQDKEGASGVVASLTPRSLALFAVPSLLYAFNNNLQMYAVTLMPAAVFELLLSLRVVLTGIAFQAILGRRLSSRQWLAAVLLCFGAAVAQALPSANSADAADDAPTFTGIGFYAVSLTLLYCLVSVGAGVYSETLLKSAVSLNIANMHMYTVGCAANVAAVFLQAWWSPNGLTLDLFRGWYLWHPWVVCTLQAMQGLLISRIMRSLDSIVKNFASALSNVLMYAASVMFMGVSFTPLYLVALGLVSAGGRMYTAQPLPTAEKDTELPTHSPTNPKVR